jgi:hypothetical protein
MSSQSLSVSLAQHLRMDLSAYADLPPAGEPWSTKDTDLDGGDINALRHQNVIEEVDRDDRNCRIWRTRAPAWERIEALREDLGVLPCGHRPFRTVDLDSERPYACRDDDCDARYVRAEIEAVIDDA